MIVRLDPMVKTKGFDTESPPTVTVTVKLKGPVALGLPLKTFPLSARPGGIVLAGTMDHVAAPPGPSEALNVTE